MSGFEVLEELWERVLTSLSAQSLVSAAVSPGEADIFMSTSWNPLYLKTRETCFWPLLFVKSSPYFSITNLAVKILTDCHNLLWNPFH